jgi:cytochrome c551/c552
VGAVLHRISVVAVAVVLAACGSKSAPPPAQTGSTAVATQVTSSDPRAALFIQKGCPQCHSISAFGVKSTTDVGPDLTLAYADVQNRFGVKLEQFLHNPTGTMQMVLGSMIQLSPAERDSVIHILRQLHEEHEHAGQH